VSERIRPMSHDVSPHAASPWHTLDAQALSLPITNHTDHDEALAREVQYRPGRFDCTGKRQHDVRTRLADGDNKNLNKRPKPLQQTPGYCWPTPPLVLNSLI